MPIVIDVRLVNTDIGPIIVIMNQHEYHRKSKSIYRSIWMECYKNSVNDKSMKAGGEKNIITNDNYVIPLSLKNVILYMDLQP